MAWLVLGSDQGQQGCEECWPQMSLSQARGLWWKEEMLQEELVLA